jgi:mannosyltransferase
LEPTDCYGIISFVTVEKAPPRTTPRLAAVVAIFGFAVVWNAWRLSSPSMWSDELATVSTTRSGPSGIVDVVRNQDAVMAPFYFFIESWTSVFGTSDASYRFPSVVAVGVAAVAAFFLAEKYVGPVESCIVAALVIASPSMTRYAQEARVYGFVIAVVLVATVLLHEALERRQRSWWVAYSVVLVAVAAGHFLGLMVIASHLVLAVGRGVPWRSLAAAVAPGILLGVLIAGIGLTQTAVIEWIPKGGVWRLQVALELLAGGGIAAMVLLLSGAAFTVWVAVDRDRRATLSWLIVIMAMPLVLWVAGNVTHIFNVRYVLWVVPFYLFAAVIVWSRLGRTFALICAAGMIVVWVPVQLDVRAPDGHTAAYRDAVRYLDENAGPTDVIRSNDLRTRQSVQRYSETLRAVDCAELVRGVTWELVRGADYAKASSCPADRSPVEIVEFTGVTVVKYAQ